MTDAPDGPVIRNLSNLAADMRGALRDVLHAIHDIKWERGYRTVDGAIKEIEEALVAREKIASIEMKVRRVLELLTGSRD